MKRRTIAEAGFKTSATVLLACVLLLCGCAALVPKLEPPKLEVTNVVLRGGSLNKQRIAVTFKVTNPNDRQVGIERIDCHIALSGHDFASGQTDAPFILPALGESDFQLDLTADLASALQVLAQQMGAKEVSYRLTGEVHLSGGLLRNFPFTKDGRIALK